MHKLTMRGPAFGKKFGSFNEENLFRDVISVKILSRSGENFAEGLFAPKYAVW